jgi:rhodanese-related sulfurtransferase
VALPDKRGVPEIGVDELDELVAAGQVRVLDVREDWEWRRGHVGGAIHVPLSQLPALMFQLPRDRPLAVICEHGERSLVATHYLLARGFEGSVSVGGGTAAWVRGNRPLERE